MKRAWLGLVLIISQTPTAHADDALDGAYRFLRHGQTSRAKSVVEEFAGGPAGAPAPGWERLRTRIELDSFANEGALAKDPSVADALTPGAFTKPEKTCYGLVDASAGFTTNAQTLQGLAPGAGADGSTLLKLNADCLLGSDPTSAFRVDYQGAATFFGRASRGNYEFHDVTFPLSLYRDRFRVRVVPEAYADVYAGENFSNDYGATVDVARMFSETYVGLGATRLQVRNVTAESRALSGYQQRLQLSVQRRRDAVAAFANGYVGTVAFDDTPKVKSAFTLRGANFGARLDRKPWDLTALASVERQAYDRGDGDPWARVDNKYILDLQGGRRLTDSVRVYLEANRTESRSNLNEPEDRYFRQFQTYAGIVAAF